MKTKYVLYNVLLISILSLASCNIQPVDFEPFDDSSEDPPSNTSTDYWPMAVNNTWTYDQELDGQAASSTTISITGTEMIDDTNYFVLENFLGAAAALDDAMLENFQVNTFVRQEGDNYFVRLSELTAEISGLLRITQEGYQYTILRDEDAVGTTLTETFEIETSFESLNPLVPDPDGVTANYTSIIEVLERDMTIMINGETFSPVIKLRQILTADFNDPMFPTTEITNDHYFALDVGIIRLESTIRDDDGTITSEQTLNINSFSLN